jgi:hypothetical protein
MARMRSILRRHTAVAIVAALVCGGGLAVAPSRVAAAGGSSVTVDGGGAATNEAVVELTIAPPSDASSQIRLSNDGSSWQTMPWTASVAWDLTDPTTGGSSADGVKTVTAEYGDGGTWTPAGSDDIVYDTTAPIFSFYSIDNDNATTNDWRVWAAGGSLDTGSGVSSVRVSLDGETWSPWEPIGDALDYGSVDLRTLMIGGNWDLGERWAYAQVRDAAGNESVVLSDSIVLTQPPPQQGEGPVTMRFEFPRKAVSGQLFTIRPVFPPGYVKPAGLYCEWMLHWGDQEALYVQPNETFGELLFDRAASHGGCGDWTFTLPATPVPHFQIMFQAGTKDDMPAGWMGLSEGIYTSPNTRIMEFDAEVGTTDRHIHESSIPILYLLPDTTVSQAGDSVTYRLYASGGQAVPNSGMFWAYPINCYINPQWSQTGGASWTYRPSCSGPWVTGWTGTYKGDYMRSQYDPIVDGRAPTVKAPVTMLRPGAFGTLVPAKVVWSATDSGSGVYQYQLQRSLNGGTWKALALPYLKTTSLDVALGTTGTYQYRVRARDRTGNWSGWVVGAKVKPALFQETYAGITYSGTWTTEAGSAWSGGAARTTDGPSASATFRFNGRAVSWAARTGPGRGFAEVRVDGVLMATIDLEAATEGARQAVYARSWTSIGIHTISVKVLGTVDRPRGDVDGFWILR